MADYLVTDTELTSVADAIRTKGGTSASLAFPSGFVTAVQNIPTGGITPTGTKQISITQNGTTTEDVTNYASAEITVNVSGGGGSVTQDQDGYIVLPTTGGGTVQDKWIRPVDWPDYDKYDFTNEECQFFTYDSSMDTLFNWCSFSAEVTGGFTVERGYLTNGTWTVETSTDVASNELFIENLPTDRDYTVYKIRPTVSGNHITQVTMGTNDNISHSNDNYKRQPCIERYGNLPYAIRLGRGWAYRNWVNYYVVSDTQLDLSSLTSLSGLFNGCNRLENISYKNMGNGVTGSCDSLFKNCYSLKYLNATEFKITSAITSLASTFSNCNSIKKLDLSEWDTSNVTTMTSLFDSCMALEEIDLTNWDASNVTNFYNMFYNCRSLKKLKFTDVAQSTTTKLTNIRSMFQYCHSLIEIDISGMEVSGCSDNTNNVFYGCASLRKVDVTGWDTSNFTNFSSIFGNSNCVDTYIGINDFDYSSATITTNAFTGNDSLRGSIELNNITTVGAGMFSNCRLLDEIIFNVSSVPILENTNAFGNVNFAGGARIKFPASLVATAKAATNWSTYADYIEAISS